VLFTLFLSSCAVPDVDSNGEQGLLTVNGKIRLVGNEPFTHLVVTTDHGRDYLIVGDLEKELRAHQYQKMTVTGVKLPPGEIFEHRIEVKEYKILNQGQ
jgi:hypothetical protein